LDNFAFRKLLKGTLVIANSAAVVEKITITLGLITEK